MLVLTVIYNIHHYLVVSQYMFPEV